MVRKRELSIGMIAVMCVLGFASCNDRTAETDTCSDASGRETMYQVATLQSLMVGNYDGFVRIDDLKRHGDIGIGTFDRANGEMVVLDGVVYQALGDGTVRMAADSETTPFATVTCFDADITFELHPFDSISSLSCQLDSMVDVYGRNFIYVLRMEVSAESVIFRSELPQEKPYGPLAEVLPGKQRSFTHQNLTGTIVAVYFPSFFAGLNTPGWHFHFISDDRKQGGHLQELSLREVSTVQLDVTPFFCMYLPEDDAFSRRDLSDNMSEDIGKVEH